LFRISKIKIDTENPEDLIFGVYFMPYILQKIKDCGLGMHSFYIYVLPFNDAEEEKKSIMEAVLEGDVDLI